MATMYEMIMDLPLFKGVSSEQVSSFLEKTNVQFLNYEDGETIIKAGEQCLYVKYLIRGKVMSSISNRTRSMTITETRGFGTVFSPERLFGMDTEFTADVVAIGNVSIMQFSKEQYMSLLRTDAIYMLNFLNYLSLHSQRPIDAIRMLDSGSFEEQLAIWVISFTESNATDICINCELKHLSGLTNFSEEKLKEDLNELAESKLIEFDEKCIKIISRKALIDYVLSKANDDA